MTSSWDLKLVLVKDWVNRMDINIRELAVLSLVEMEKEEVFLSQEMTAVLDKYDYMDARDKAFFKRLLSGTTERKIRIDYILDLFSGTKVKKMKPFIRALLRTGVYQIMWMDSVPDSAVCNESVKLAVKHKFAGLKGFVNGVLRNICRNKDKIEYPDASVDFIKYMSVFYSCPEWIVRQMDEEYGREATENYLKASMEEKPVSVRLRCPGSQADNLIKEWMQAGITVLNNEYTDEGRFLSGVEGVANLYGFDEGLFTVQDTGSMMVAAMAGIKAGDIIMDVCAAPGGKSMHAADILCRLEKDTEAKGHVYSYDISEDRCEKILDNIERLGIKNVSVKAADATAFIPEMEEKADVVIVDAPCSGLGVIGRKSDIKYRVTPEDIESLHKLQRQILKVAVRYVKPGGKLIYSTCTVTKAENTLQAEFIENELKLHPAKIYGEETALQLLPGRDKSDGFFIAGFTK